MRTVVLYPSPGMGHLISMVELGKFIVKHHPEYGITILIITPPFHTGYTASYIKGVSASTTSITFHSLPFISLPLDLNSYPSMEAVTYSLLQLSKPCVHQALQSISLTTTISAFILDFFCSSALSIATDLNIPAYYFYTSGANTLAIFLYFPTLHKKTTKSFKDMDILDLPGLPIIPSSDMPQTFHERTSSEYASFLDTAIHFPKSSGIIINTFDSLEDKLLKLISKGTYIPDGPTPPLFCLGPLIASDKQSRREGGAGEAGGVHECLQWLEMQPSHQSVVFLCFGSLGLFSAEQLKEIAIGLERSEQRFLWVVRSPPSQDKSQQFVPPPEPDLDLLLPHGFLDRTKDRGLVVKSWAPQVEILSHKSVGGFVTHCGWNSVLEAVFAGVPMVAWPLYAEQKFNRLFLVEEMKLALPMNEKEGGFVTAVEVEKRVRELMDSEGGRLIRERVQAKREEAKQAMGNEGSSRVALAKLVDAWKLPE